VDPRFGVCADAAAAVVVLCSTSSGWPCWLLRRWVLESSVPGRIWPGAVPVVCTARLTAVAASCRWCLNQGTLHLVGAGHPPHHPKGHPTTPEAGGQTEPTPKVGPKGHQWGNWRQKRSVSQDRMFSERKSPCWIKIKSVLGGCSTPPLQATNRCY